MTLTKKISAAMLLLCLFTCLPALEGKVLEVTGKVELQDGDRWVAVKKNDVLRSGSVISTGFKSEAVISFDETTIKVKALTRLSIEQLYEQNGDKASTVYLDTGSITADVKPAENKRVAFTVKSPAATASVRGTMGEVYSDGTVKGLEGVWCITPPEPKADFLLKAAQKEPAAEEETLEEPVSDEMLPEEMLSEGGPVADMPETETSPVVDLPVIEQAPVIEPVDLSPVEQTDFDFSYPKDMGAIFVNPGELAVFSSDVMLSPMESQLKQASGSNGVQLLSTTESESLISITPAVEAGKPADVVVPVPEKPKYGTVEAVIKLPE